MDYFFGTDNNAFISKLNHKGPVPFSVSFFGQDPCNGYVKDGYIKIGNATDMINVGEENCSYKINHNECCIAIYGILTEMHCKFGVKKEIVFNNDTFGDPFLNEKKQAYIILSDIII
jgi:hypothetical protein